MARFRGTVQGSRGSASRLGHRDLTATVNGWDCGVRVTAAANSGEPGEVFTVSVTGGSNGSTSKLVAVIVLDTDGNVRCENLLED